MVSDTGSVSGITSNVPGPPGPPEVAPGDHRRGATTWEIRWAKWGWEPAPRWVGAPPTPSPMRKWWGEGATLGTGVP